MARKKIEVTPAMQQETERLAALGLNEKQISEALGMAYSSFQKHKAAHFREALKKGRAQLRERITSALLAKISDGDTTALIFTAKRLNLFSESMDKATAPKTAREAVNELSRIYQAVAVGDVGEQQGERLAAMVEKIIKAIEVGDIEERLTALEEKTNESTNSKA